MSVKSQITGSVEGNTNAWPPLQGVPSLKSPSGLARLRTLNNSPSYESTAVLPKGLFHRLFLHIYEAWKTRSQPSTLNKVLKYETAKPVSSLSGVWCSLLVESHIPQHCMMLSPSKNLSLVVVEYFSGEARLMPVLHFNGFHLHVCPNTVCNSIIGFTGITFSSIV